MVMEKINQAHLIDFMPTWKKGLPCHIIQNSRSVHTVVGLESSEMQIV